MPSKPSRRKTGVKGRGKSIDSSLVETSTEIVDSSPPTEGEVYAYSAVDRLTEVGSTLTEILTGIDNALWDQLEQVDIDLASIKGTLALNLASQYTPIISTVSQLKELIRDRLTYSLATVNEILGQTPSGPIVTPRQRREQDDYRQRFLTGTLPIHGIGDPPGDTVADVAAVFSLPRTRPVSTSTIITGLAPTFPSPLDPTPPSDTPTSTPTPTPTPTPTSPPDKQPPPVKDDPSCHKPQEAGPFVASGPATPRKPAPSWDYFIWTDSYGAWGKERYDWYVPLDWTIDKTTHVPVPPARCKPDKPQTPTPTPTTPPTTPQYPPSGGGPPGVPGGPSPTSPGGGPGIPTTPTTPTTPGGPGQPPKGPGGPTTPTTPGGPTTPTGPGYPFPTPTPTPTPGGPTTPGAPGVPTTPGGPGGPTPTPEPVFPPPWSPTPTPTGPPSPGLPTPTPAPGEPTPGLPTPPGQPGVSKGCTGEDREHPCWREIGGYQGSDYEIFSGPGWISRTVVEGFGEGNPGKAVFPVAQKVIAVAEQPKIPGVCDELFQFRLVNPMGLLEDLGKTVDKGLEDIGNKVKTQSKGKTWLFGYAVAPFMAAMTVVVDLLGGMFNQAVNSLELSGSCLNRAVSSEGTLNLLNWFTFGGCRKVKDIIQRRNDFDCPTMTLSAAEATAAYLADEITFCEYEAYVRADNRIFGQYSVMVGVGKYKFTVNELQMLKMRGGLTEEQLKERLKRVGVIDTSITKELDLLSQNLPGVGDLVRFMVRDVADEKVVADNGYDRGFVDKWTGKLKDWGKSQGFSDEVAKYFWRAHWEIPSPTQLYNVYHRLRRDPKGQGEARLKERIKEALVQQDIAPAWVDDLLKVSFNPLTRTDAKRAFNEGLIDEDQLELVFVENGYNDEDSKRLVKFAKAERREYIKNREPIKFYADGVIGIQETRDAMIAMGFDPGLMGLVDEIATQERNWKVNAKTLEHLVSAYRTYKVSYGDAMRIGEKAGLNAAGLKARLDDESLIRSFGSKHIAIGAMCKMLDEGVIIAEQFVQEATSAGWNTEDANRHLQSCSNKIEARRAKAQLQESEKARKAAEKEQRQSEQDAKAAERERMSILNQLVQLEQRRQTRNKVLDTAATKYAALSGEEPGLAAATILDAWDGVQVAVGLSQDEAASLVRDVANNWGKFGEEDFKSVVTRLAGAASREPFKAVNPSGPAE